MKAACKMCHCTGDEFLFTECDHLLCLSCALPKWDRNFSLKCCQKLTFLEPETRRIFLATTLHEPAPIDPTPSTLREKARLPMENVSSTSNADFQSIMNTFQRTSVIGGRLLDQDAIALSQLSHTAVSPLPHDAPHHEVPAAQSDLLSVYVARVKREFDAVHQQLYEREEKMIREINEKCGRQEGRDSAKLRHDLEEYLQDQLGGKQEWLKQNQKPQERPQERPQEKPQEKLKQKQKTRDNGKWEEGCAVDNILRGDKILEKLEYNQLRMREKLSKHYL